MYFSLSLFISGGGYQAQAGDSFWLWYIVYSYSLSNQDMFLTTNCKMLNTVSWDKGTWLVQCGDVSHGHFEGLCLAASEFCTGWAYFDTIFSTPDADQSMPFDFYLCETVIFEFSLNLVLCKISNSFYCCIFWISLISLWDKVLCYTWKSSDLSWLITTSKYF